MKYIIFVAEMNSILFAKCFEKLMELMENDEK